MDPARTHEPSEGARAGSPQGAERPAANQGVGPTYFVVTFDQAILRTMSFTLAGSGT
jgi:hypothetical protein